jgi:hypothetical protein
MEQTVSTSSILTELFCGTVKEIVSSCEIINYVKLGKYLGHHT